MLTQEQKQQFDKDGYLLVPNILTSEQVKRLRDFFRPKFDLPPDQRLPGDTSDVLYDIYSRYPELRWLLFHEPTNDILRSLLGNDFVAILHEAEVFFNRSANWHKDTTLIEVYGQDFHLQPDFLMVTIAYYLQDNNPEYGGGLDLVPGSHRSYENPAIYWDAGFANKLPKSGFLQRVKRKVSRTLAGFANKLPKSGFLERVKRRVSRTLWPQSNGAEQHTPRGAVSIPSKAGDLVIFHYRIDHRGTPSRHTVIPEDHAKLVVFTGYSRNHEYARTYDNLLHNKPDFAFAKDYTVSTDLAERARDFSMTLI
jgi:hypothetical protein